MRRTTTKAVLFPPTDGVKRETAREDQVHGPRQDQRRGQGHLNPPDLAGRWKQSTAGTIHSKKYEICTVVGSTLYFYYTNLF